jgi:hypothetical protein
VVRKECAERKQARMPALPGKKKRPAPTGQQALFIFLLIPFIESRASADRTLTSVPVYRHSHCYFPGRISNGRFTSREFEQPTPYLLKRVQFRYIIAMRHECQHFFSKKVVGCRWPVVIKQLKGQDLLKFCILNPELFNPNAKGPVP